MSEVRLIDANALKESLKELKAEGYNQKYVKGLQDAIDYFFPQIIDDMPTIKADSDLISRTSLLATIAELKESPWHNFGKVDGTSPEGMEAIWHYGYLQRKEAVEIIEDMCIKKEPAVQADSGWISVKDRLPDKSQRVFVFYKALGEKNRIHNDVMATNWRTNKGDFIPCDGYKVTHWQPLPKPPKGE